MIKYVCISDLHAGAPNSLLMPPPTQFTANPEHVPVAFAQALGQFLDVAGAEPQLILLGDVLDLQFSDRAHAYPNALTFLELLAATKRFKPEVIVTAGNHDHALWTDARLALDADLFSTDAMTPRYRQSTPAFTQTPAAQGQLLRALITQAGFGSVDFRYPNIGFQNEHRAVVLHHGHFVEDEYRLMTKVKELLLGGPETVNTAEQVASENAGWLDFFWSTTGDAGLGRAASDFYQSMLTSVGFRHIADDLAQQIADALRDKLPLAGNLTVQEVVRNAALVGLDLTAGRFRDTERYAEVTALTQKGYDGVRWYLDGPVKDQITSELNALIADVSFVFGHTHKPFAERLVASAFAQPVKTYNTGGWCLNGPRLDNAEGAGMVLMDDDLNVALVRLFGTPRNGKVARASVEMLVDTPGAVAFRDDVHDWLNASGNHWDALADAAHEAYLQRQAYLLDLTAQGAAR